MPNSLDQRRQTIWQAYDTATLDALRKQHRTIWRTYAAGLADADQTTVRLLRVGIALRRATRASRASR